MTEIGVYRTSVTNRTHAERILKEIRRQLPGSRPSFDLEDCDHVLRVEHRKHGVQESEIRNILKRFGHKLESLL